MPEKPKPLRVGIFGLGVVGSALYLYLREVYDDRVEFRLVDPVQDFSDSIADCDCVFICVPADTRPDRSQDLTQVESCLAKIRESKTLFSKPIFLKSTVLPGTCDRLGEQYMLHVYHMPEFLTERRANTDMMDHAIVCGGRPTMSYEHLQFVQALFQGKQVHFMSNVEAELAKYAHNCFAAVKVNYFNIVYDLCQKLKADYQQVLQGCSITGFIEKTHTQVPGHDGKRGYGGKCLPKDLAAFHSLLVQYLEGFSSIRATELENSHFREQS